MLSCMDKQSFFNALAVCILDVMSAFFAVRSNIFFRFFLSWISSCFWNAQIKKKHPDVIKNSGINGVMLASIMICYPLLI